MSANTIRDQTKLLWLVRLGSALRTTLACTIIGCTTLYGPGPVRQLLAYPAFSYVTAILIVSEATLGDTLRGCWHALYATIQVMIPSILTLRVIGPERFTIGSAAVAVAITAFMVALPESTSLMTKRIAFGQSVIVYVGAVIHGADAGVVMHPVHVASSTAFGALASVLVMLVPYPRLAYYEVRKACRLYAENASKRLDLFVDAFTAQDKQAATHSLTQAQILSKTGVRHLQTIKDGQEGMMWEIPLLGILNRKSINTAENLQDIEMPMRGMEIALNSSPSFPVGMIDEGLEELLLGMEGKVRLKLEQAKCLAPFDATTAPEIKGELSDNYVWAQKTSDAALEDLPAFFFLYCMEHTGEPPIYRNPKCIAENTKETDARDVIGTKDMVQSTLRKTWNALISFSKGWKARWTFAIKCSLSLGFAVLFGLIFNKENGYWSGLTIAISFVIERQATFTVANARGQGTAMGSVYGILCCFIFQGFVHLRFLSLLPWIIFTSFMRHSRMYGQGGATSAVIGALLIVGRKNYGPPSEFAIARLTEACIGLMCFITVEILLQPARAATLAKTEFAWSLGALRDCVDNISLYAGQKSVPRSILPTLRGKQQKLKSHINKLEKFIAEAESEPNFWFLPFNGACYHKLLASLTKMEYLLLFAAYEIETLSQVSEGLGVDWKELQELINNDLDLFREKVGFSLKCLEEVILIKSLPLLENEVLHKTISDDIELGKSPNADTFRTSSLDEEEILEIESSFLQHTKEEVIEVLRYEGAQKLKSQLTLCLYSLGFCISSLMRETIEIEKELKQLIAWENPTRNINLYEISCKINALNEN